MQVSAGQTFVKTWRMRNTGTCTWAGAYSLDYHSGERMAAPSYQLLRSSVPPGAEVDVSVRLVAPEVAGMYSATWQLSDPAYRPFGPLVYVQIAVGRLTDDRLPDVLMYLVGGGGGPCGGVLGCVAEPTFEADYKSLRIYGFPPGEKATVSISASNGRTWSRTFRIPTEECYWPRSSNESVKQGTVTALEIWPDWSDPDLTTGIGWYRVQSNSTTMEGVVELRAPEVAGPRLEITRAGYPKHNFLMNASAEGCGHQPIQAELLPEERAFVYGTGFPANTVLTIVMYRDATLFRQTLFRHFIARTDSQGRIDIPLESMTPGDFWIAALDSPERSFHREETDRGAIFFLPNYAKIPAFTRFSVSDTGGDFSFIFCSAADFDQQTKRCMRPTTGFTRPVRIIYASWSRPNNLCGNTNCGGLIVRILSGTELAPT